MGNLDHSAADPAPEPQRTECLTSNATLFWRVFVPIFGTVFLAGLTLALLLISEENLFLSFPALWARVTALLLLLSWLLLIKRTVWRLKRADANETHLFVTNFWHTVRYPWSDIDRIEESQRMGRRLVHFHLKASGRFGQIISILPAAHFDVLMKSLRGLGV